MQELDFLQYFKCIANLNWKFSQFSYLSFRSTCRPNSVLPKISENYLLGITKANIKSLDKALGVQPPKLHSQPDLVPSPCKHNTDIVKKVNFYVPSIWHPFLLEAIYIL